MHCDVPITGRLAPIVVAGAVLASLVGCSSDHSGAIPPRPTQESTRFDSGLSSGCADECKVFLAAQAYSDAYLTGHASTAYRLLSERCQAQVTQKRFGTFVARANEQYGAALPIKKQTFHADVSRQVVAFATYSYDVPGFHQESYRERWVRVGGHWRLDDC